MIVKHNLLIKKGFQKMYVCAPGVLIQGRFPFHFVSNSRKTKSCQNTLPTPEILSGKKFGYVSQWFYIQKNKLKLKY